MAKSLYELLGVQRNAGAKDIRAAYRKLARKYHPDVNPNDKAAESRFKDISNAYEVLGDPANRSKYDKYGEQWQHADEIERQQRRHQQSSRFGGLDTSNISGDFGSIFDSVFGGRRRSGGRKRGQDVETPVQVSLREAFGGTTRVVQDQVAIECSTCDGEGQVSGAVCHTCRGSGQTNRQTRLEVKIPAGVKTGSRVRMASKGQPGTGGGKPGDLYLIVTVTGDSEFRREGNDLHAEVDVPLMDAVLGGEVTVQTLDGRVALRIPELTQNGATIRLASKGMPVLGKTDERGVLVVRVKVALPEALTNEERSLFEQLRAAQTSDQAAS